MRPRPISNSEFVRFFQKARPPSGWPVRIGVANSGGPDSTCLLFLIHRYIAESTPSPKVSPECVYSLTVDHALQKFSAQMAAKAADNAKNLHIHHTTARIEWGKPPFPPLPRIVSELKPRNARYHLLWKWMQKEHIGVLAMAHHLDDQVETSLMRLGSGSSELGARGMLKCRRWGMGNHNDMEWVGHEGMNKWLIRPLLEVTKDRILATCDENRLSYTIDPTNFQPEYTLRNTLRAIISSSATSEPPPDPEKSTSKTRQSIEAINAAMGSISHLSINLNSPPERLRLATKMLNDSASDIEDQATSHLERIRLVSPPGTFILATHPLQSITNTLVRRAIILRILRYVSFRPWGSLQAQAKRDKHSLGRIIKRVWNMDPLNSPESRPFTSGAGVLWTPVLIDMSQRSPEDFLLVGGKIKTPNARHIKDGHATIGQGTVGWIASRQPPSNPQTLKENGVDDTANVDITVTLRDALKLWDEGRGEGPSMVEMLWDCRFLIKFNLTKVPTEFKTALLTGTFEGPIIAIRPWSRYCLPKVVLLPKGAEIAWTPSEGKEAVVLHSNIDSHKPPTLLFRAAGLSQKNPIAVISDWITTSWIRVLDEI